jgi:hypothetical protein
MTTILLQFDFPFEGPWGEAMTAALDGLAHDIAAEDGLLWKIWTENEGIVARTFAVNGALSALTRAPL